MKKLNILLPIVLSVLVLPDLLATDRCMLEVEYLDGKTIMLDTEGLVIAAKDNKLNCTGPETQIEIDIKDLAALEFFTDSTAIPSVQSDSRFSVFTDKGIFLGEYDSIQDVRDIMTEQGVFILKSGNRSVKLVKK